MYEYILIHGKGFHSGIDAGLIYRLYCVHTSEVCPNMRKSKISAFVKKSRHQSSTVLLIWEGIRFQWQRCNSNFPKLITHPSKNLLHTLLNNVSITDLVPNDLTKFQVRESNSKQQTGQQQQRHSTLSTSTISLTSFQRVTITLVLLVITIVCVEFLNELRAIVMGNNGR